MAIFEEGIGFPKRGGHVCAPYKDCILIWGGWKKSGTDCIYYPSDELWCYRPLTKQWTLKKCHLCSNGEPPSLVSATSTLMGDHLYVFGGCNKLELRTIIHMNVLYRLSLVNFTWEKLDINGLLPLAVDKLVSWTYNEKLYIFGGFGNRPGFSDISHGFQFMHDEDFLKGWTNQFFEYDPVQNKWSVPKYEGGLPSCRAAHAAATAGNHVYIFGGRHVHTRVKDLHCLDMRNMLWSEIIPANGSEPQGRSWHSFTAISDTMLLLYGGFSYRSEPLSDCWIFHIPSSRWQKITLAIETPCFWHSACFTSDNDLAINGGCYSQLFDTKEYNMLLIRLFPKSLFRLCLEFVEKNNLLSSSLPQNIQIILNKRSNPHKMTIYELIK